MILLSFTSVGFSFKIQSIFRCLSFFVFLKTGWLLLFLMVWLCTRVQVALEASRGRWAPDLELQWLWIVRNCQKLSKNFQKFSKIFKNFKKLSKNCQKLSEIVKVPCFAWEINCAKRNSKTNTDFWMLWSFRQFLSCLMLFAG